MLPFFIYMVAKKIHDLTVRVSQLEGRYHALQLRKDELVNTIAVAKGRLALHTTILSIFDKLQTRATDRSVGRFEKLLSSIVADVMPGTGSIKLATSVKNNAPALDFWIQKPDGKLEDILTGNGGTVANLVCVGNRFITLHRTSNRKLMMLDEPDCWVSADYTPAFSKMLYEVAEASKTQLTYISHRPLSLQDARFNHVKLEPDLKNPFLVKDPDSKEFVSVPRIVAKVVKGTDWESDEQVGVRGLHLKGFYIHYDTYLPMFPGATLYTGAGNVGKSAALYSSWRALAYNEVSSLCVHHYAKESSVRADLENNTSIEWSRKPNRNPVTIYTLRKDGKEVMKESPDRSGLPPKWVSDLLGVNKVEDIDIQVPDQKVPIFLLDSSPSMRAKLLSLGRESSHLTNLIKAYNKVRAKDLEIVSAGEIELVKVNKQLQCLQPVLSLTEKVHKLHSTALELDTCDREFSQARDFNKDWVNCTERHFILSCAPSALTVLEDKHLKKANELSLFIADLQKLHFGSMHLTFIPDPVSTSVVLHDSLPLGQLHKDLMALKSANAVLQLLPSSISNDGTDYMKMYSTLADGMTLANSWTALRHAKQLLSQLPSSIVGLVLNSDTQKVKEFVVEWLKLKQAHLIYEMLPSATLKPVIVDSTDVLSALIKAIREEIGQVSEYGSQLLVLEQEYLDAQQVSQRILDELGYCPACGTKNVKLEGHIHA